MARSNHPLEEKASEPFVQRGKTLIVGRQYQEAVKACRLGLLARPTCVEGRIVLSMALMALGRVDEVLAEIRVALDVEPDNAVALLVKGEALHKKERHREAYLALVRAAELDPNNEKVVSLLEEVAEEIDDVEELVESSGYGIRGITTKVYPSRRAQQELPRSPQGRSPGREGLGRVARRRAPTEDPAREDFEPERTEQGDGPADSPDPAIAERPRGQRPGDVSRAPWTSSGAPSRLAALQRDALRPGLTAGYRETQMASSDDDDDDTFTTAPFLAPSTDLSDGGGGWGGLMTDIDEPLRGQEPDDAEEALGTSDPVTFTTRDPAGEDAQWSEEAAIAEADDSLMTAPERGFLAGDSQEGGSLVTKTGQEDGFSDDTVDQSLVTLRGDSLEFEAQLAGEASLITRTVSDDGLGAGEEATKRETEEQRAQSGGSWRLAARATAEDEEDDDNYQAPSAEALFGEEARGAAMPAAGEFQDIDAPGLAPWHDSPPRNPGDPTSAMKVGVTGEEEPLSLAGLPSGPGTISAPTVREADDPPADELPDDSVSRETQSEVIELSRVSVIADLSEVPSDCLPAAMPPLPAESGESSLEPTEDRDPLEFDGPGAEDEEEDEATRVRFDAPGSEQVDDVIFARSPPLEGAESKAPAEDRLPFESEQGPGADYPEEDRPWGEVDDAGQGYYGEDPPQRAHGEPEFAQQSLDAAEHERVDYAEPDYREPPPGGDFVDQYQQPGEFDFEPTNDRYAEPEAPQILDEGLEERDDSVPTRGGYREPAPAVVQDYSPPVREPTEHFGEEDPYQARDETGPSDQLKPQWSGGD